jgi:23S rRNA (cytosine1962-C5)-methyltransferase
VNRPILSPAPLTLRTPPWDDYALIDCGSARKLERYGRFTVVRPEPQCFWAPALSDEVWAKADAVFDPTDEEDDGRWRTAKPIPDTWPMRWPIPGGPIMGGPITGREVRFKARLTAFRHLAFFPEQAANWAWLDQRVRAQRERGGEAPRILNLFGYTGVASLVCAAAGAHVTHVDASKKSVGWAREDARRYVQREVRRGAHYDGIILDPPKYGRGPGGEVWRLFEDLTELTTACAALLSDRADFMLLNAYAARVSGLSLAHLLHEAVAARGGAIDWGELALAQHETPQARAIGLSFFARWRSDAA